MIIYNFRANGPYEYDKFVLNFGQLYNLCANTKNEWKQSQLWLYNKELANIIYTLTNSAEENILSRLVLLKETVTE